MCRRSLPEAALDLYGLAPGEFVGARNALVKSLKREKRTEDAAAVAALRRPSVADHAINAAARADAQLATVWAAAVVSVSDEQSAAIGGGSAQNLRAATAALREATRELADAAVAVLGNESKRSEVLGALRAATTRPGAAMVAAGILGAADPTDELFAGAPDPPAAAVRAPRRGRGATQPVIAPEPPPEEPVDEPVDESADEVAAAAAERVRVAEEAVALADAARDAAEADERAARAALDAAHDRLTEAAAAAKEAAAELAKARKAAAP